MSLWEATFWTWLRSLFLSGCVLLVIARINCELNGVPKSQRKWIWGVLLLPLLTPGFLVGYAYGRGLLALREWQWWNELAYLFLSIARWMPLGLLIVRLAPPPPLTPAGRHCWKLSQRGVRTWRGSLADCETWLSFGEGKKYLLAFGLLFLVTFHDFDLAALLGIQSWNVWLFDAQGAGMALTETLQRLIVPLLVQVATLAPILWFSGRGWNLTSERTFPEVVSSGRIFLIGWSLLAGLGGCLVPWGLVITEGAPGFTAIWRQGNQWLGLLQEGMNGLVAGITSGCVAILVSRWICDRGNRSRKWSVRDLLLIPGLVGPLAIGFFMLAGFQISWIARFSPPGLSWLLGLVIWLIPIGVLLLLGLRSQEVPMALHLGEILKQSSNGNQRRSGWRIWWKLRGDEWIWGVVPLVWWSYFDLTISSILAPPGSVSAPVRLFNQMHYGHSAMLSALTGGAVLIPVVCLTLLLMIRRIWLRGGVQ